MQQSSKHAADAETVVIREQVWPAYLLAWIAAFSDAIGFLVLQQLGASFMSGNSMVTGVALGRSDWTSVLNHGLPILSFILGMILGVLVRMQLRHWGMHASFAPVFGLEGICLLTFLIVGSHVVQKGIIPSSQAGIFYLCIVLLTGAMGLQTSTLRRIGSQAIHTTFVTGVLSDLTDTFIQYLSWLHSQAIERQLRQAVRESMQQASFRHLLLLGGTWGCYVVGAVCGSALEQRLTLTALVFPLCVLVVLIVIDLVRPFDR